MTVPSSLSVLPSRSTCLGVRGDHLAGDLADDLQHAAVVVDRVGGVERGVVGLAVVGVQSSCRPGDLRQVDVVEQELDVFVIEKEIRHELTPAVWSCLGRRRDRYPAVDYRCRSLIALIIIGITLFRSPTMP